MDPEGSHIVKLTDAAIGYHPGEPLLDRIRLEVHLGEMVALIGRNGTGKSTLLKSMIGLLPLLEGSCLLDRQPLAGYSPRNRARKVSYVSSQLSQLPSITVGELVALGRMPHTGWMGRLGEMDWKMVEDALGVVRMKPYINRKLEHLSDGERQRSLIARAFVQDTPLMVLDEPAAFLDIPGKYDLIRLLRGFRDRGKSIVYSTHDLETALITADKIWVIVSGKILEGAPEDLGISGIYQSLFEQSGITFEEERRRFKYSEPAAGRIRLTGDPGSVTGWTRNALERIGFEVDQRSEQVVKVVSDSSGFFWEVTTNGKQDRFNNIYTMAQFLTKGN